MPAVIAVVALMLLAIGGVRLPADLIALPGTLIAKKTNGRKAHSGARTGPCAANSRCKSSVIFNR
jgi:hypothetical protein